MLYVERQKKIERVQEMKEQKIVRTVRGSKITCYRLNVETGETETVDLVLGCRFKGYAEAEKYISKFDSDEYRYVNVKSIRHIKAIYEMLLDTFISNAKIKETIDE